MIRSTTTSALVLLAAASAEARPTVVPVDASDGVELARSVFVDAEGTEHVMPAGIARIDRGALAEATGLRRGYLQIITELGPVAYDVPIHLDDSETWPRALRGLRVRHGDAASAFELHVPLSDDADHFQLAQVAFTDAPLFDMRGINAAMQTVPLTSFPLGVQHEIIGGEGEMGTFAPPPVEPLPPPPMAIGAGDMVDVQFTQPASWNVETARSQCVASAFANVLAYLDGTFGELGIDFPQENTPGVGVDGDESSFVSRMDWYMDRPHTDTCNGDGMNNCGNGTSSSAIRGIFEFLYVFDSDVRIDVSHQGLRPVLPAGCGLDEVLDRESVGDNATVTWAWLCDRVQDGSGIYLNYGRYEPADPIVDPADPWTRTGGHSVRAYGCSQIGTQRFVHLLDDGEQNRMEEARPQDVCVEREGLRTRVIAVTEDEATGRLVLGGSASQIDNAVALTPAGL